MNENHISLEVVTADSILDQVRKYLYLSSYYFSAHPITHEWIAEHDRHMFEALGERFHREFNVDTEFSLQLSLFVRDEQAIKYINSKKETLLSEIDGLIYPYAEYRSYFNAVKAAVHDIADIEYDTIEDSCQWEKYVRDAVKDESEKLKAIKAEQEKLRANLLRAVSHDLRTPLTTIIGSSSSYLENYPDLTEEERTELIANIKEDSEWLLNMVENLLTVTRIREDSADKVKKSSEVVEEVVSEAILRLQKRIPQVRIRVTMPNDFLMLPMDPTLIEQVLINLIENASVHSGSREPVDLIIKETKDLVSFVVRDYGNGIDPQLLPHIFEGKHHTAVTADGHRGIGIGLSICQTIIQAHGGEISAANHAGGAEFIFTLPKEKENENYV